MRRATPLSLWESVWLVLTVILTANAIMFFYGGGPSQLLTRPVSPSEIVPSARTPLPDLCNVFRADNSPTPGLQPAPDSRTLDRNEARCSFSAPDDQEREQLRVWVQRPWDSSVHTDKDWARYAREQFTDPLGRDRLTFNPIQQLGDEAKVAVTKDDLQNEATLLVRDGLLIIDITYAAPGKDDAQLRATSERVATHLLRALPPDGR
ncbi:hypothetical protein [Actinomadura sp. 6N118]|uniref:hypothetical protein n=1 Tax=Actinomadura sp. 6N118 TaxID=3375151 RepID=UPI00379E0D1E